MDWFGDTFFIISTHAPLAGRDSIGMVSCPDGGISTHAPLAGRDIASDGIDLKSRLISTHAPLAGRDEAGEDNVKINRITFQPTRPLRGATAKGVITWQLKRYFNPRAPCGARLDTFKLIRSELWISTHAPLAGRDL